MPHGSTAKAVRLAAAAAALFGLIVTLPPIADAGPDGGLGAFNNGVPFYIPAGGNTHGSDEMITGPITKPPCNLPQSSSSPSSPSIPSIPSGPESSSSSTSPSPSPDPPPAP